MSLNIVAKHLPSGERVLILDWGWGRCLTLHSDGRLAEYRTAELRADLLETQVRLAGNQRQNVEEFIEIAEE